MKELPALPQEQPFHCSSHQRLAASHSPLPRPSSSRSGKRAASAVDAETEMAGTSAGDGDVIPNQHNPVKRRSSDGNILLIDH